MPPSRVALCLASDFVRDAKAARRSYAARFATTQSPCRLPRFNRYWRRNMRCIVDQNGKIVCQCEHIDRALAWLPNAAS
jgi:hypothetical protein